MALQLSDVLTWQTEFQSFCDIFLPAFGRVEVQDKTVDYIHGLLASLEKKNCWYIAETNGNNDPQSTQRLLRTTRQDEHQAHQLYIQYIREHFGSENGSIAVDETGFVKDGEHSVGVARQHCPPLGKVDNCQVGVFLSYCSEHGHVFLDRRLFLPEAWANDLERRKQAGVPEHIEFKTKPQLGLEMIEHLKQVEFPFQWVTGDSIYGDSPEFRQTLKQNKIQFVLGVSSNMEGWTRSPVMSGKRWFKEEKWRVDKRGPQKRSVVEIAKAMKPRKWKKLRVKEGSKGWIEYEYAAKQMIVCEEQMPGARLWLLARRDPENPEEMGFYLCNAPANVALIELARVAGGRWTVEMCFEEGKDDVGLDQYQVRKWVSWHRHTMYSMMAHLFLAELKRKYGETEEAMGALTVPEVRRLLEIALPPPEKTQEFKWSWSVWRRQHNLKAKLSHYKRRSQSRL